MAAGAGDDHDDEPVADELRRARPAQEDPIARRLEARVRAALVGAEVEPTTIDRFVVLERLGAGGMGAVYAALDPRLDRRVALKLVHARGDDARARVLAEARALARLSHPNVVAVYDSSEVDGALYIAMELVTGATLRAWLAAAPRTPAAIVDAIVQAGRGLAAAHAADLCHGDVKPDNLLVGDGVVKVADFGLARAGAGGPGGRAGTPGYMAPEQLAGGPADPRADQFALAVTLHEALAGERPFPGRTPAELARAIAAGPPAPLPSAPPRVARAVARALRPDPAARFATVAAFLDALAPPPPSRLRRIVRYAAPAVVIGGAALAIVLVRGGGEAAPACPLGDARVAAVWTPALRARTPAAVATVLDAYGRAWAEQAHETCLATRRGEQSQAMLDLRMACLDRRLDELGALAGQVAGATAPAAVDAALEAAYALTPLAPCADRDRLAGVLPPPASARAAIVALRRRLDAARLRQKTRGHADARAEIDAVVAEARAIGYPPLLGEALLARARLENHGGHADDADATLRDAIAAAAAGGDAETAARAWTTRVFVAGIMRSRPAEALAYAEAAEAVLAGLQRPAGWRGVLRMYVGEVEHAADHLDAARAALTDSVGLLAEARGGDHPLVGEALAALASVEVSRRDLPAAHRHAERALAIHEAAYGPDHQDTAVSLQQLAAIRELEGDTDGAIAGYREALRRIVAHAGPDTPYAASAHQTLGDVLRKLDRYDEARVELAAARDTYAKTTGLDTAAAIDTLAALAKVAPDTATARRGLDDVLARRIALLGADHHRVADTLNDLGNLARDDGDLPGAIALFERALATYQRALGADHPRIAVALSNLGETAIAGGRFADAAAACARALAIDEKVLGPDHPDLAYDLTCAGEAELGAGRAAAALAPLERALRLRAGDRAAPGDRARTEFALARTLWALGRDKPRARALAASAKDGFAPEGAATPAQRAEVARWLAARS